jgi:hypothetical protein
MVHQHKTLFKFPDGFVAEILVFATLRSLAVNGYQKVNGKKIFSA